VEPGSCFAGTLAELLYAADRSYMLDADNGPAIAFSSLNFGAYPMVNGDTRIDAHFCGEVPDLPTGKADRYQGPQNELGLITSTPDDIDWEEEVRIAIEERVALSPDALTGMGGLAALHGTRKHAHARVRERLSAWQNWIFVRPNAVGEQGASRSTARLEGAIQLGSV
jgi:benzoyl-CoA-dihydrodiol lyase